MEKKKVSIIIPCFCEEKDILSNVEKVKEYLSTNSDYLFNIVVVDDGSKDRTGEIIKNIKDICPVSYQPNQGKGNAVREGFKYSIENLNSDYLIFMDADLSTDLSAIPECLALLEDGTDLVVSSRYDKGSVIKIKQPFKRRFISKCSRIIIRSMFHFKLKDTQCGFKGMNKETAQLFIEKQKMGRFSFDVEYIYIAKLRNKTYKSLPIIWSDDRGSTVSPMRSSVRFFKDLFKIKRNKKHYLNGR